MSVAGNAAGRSGVPIAYAARGVAVVLPFPLALAERLAVPDGVKPQQMHLTLAFLGMADSVGSARERAVSDVLREFAVTLPVITARLSGVGRFSGAQGRDVAYVSVDSPELPVLREQLLCLLAEHAGLEADQSHAFAPHVTVAFVTEHEPHPFERVEPAEVRFDTLELWIGPRREAFALGSRPEPVTPCEVHAAADESGALAAPRALAAVVRDWTGRTARASRAAATAERRKVLLAALDELHSQVLAAFLASPYPQGAALPEEALVTRARRLRSIEADLELIFAAAAHDLPREAPGEDAAALEGYLERALRPLLSWAAHVDAPNDEHAGP